MSKRRSPEAVVVEYFMTADLDTARTMVTIVRSILDQRTGKAPARVSRQAARKLADLGGQFPSADEGVSAKR